MEIRWSLPAAEDLERICERIGRDNTEAAGRVARTVYEGCARLKDFPTSEEPAADCLDVGNSSFRPFLISPYTRLQSTPSRSRAFSTPRKTGLRSQSGARDGRASSRCPSVGALGYPTERQERGLLEGAWDRDPGRVQGSLVRDRVRGPESPPRQGWAKWPGSPRAPVRIILLRTRSNRCNADTFRRGGCRTRPWCNGRRFGWIPLHRCCS
jgi:plasmid stabilization system protein ParE